MQTGNRSNWSAPLLYGAIFLPKYKHESPENVAQGEEYFEEKITDEIQDSSEAGEKKNLHFYFLLIG